ncbi:hypothetical protein NL676_020501 [Syzygium grande]|nr:hypothetical protein NL676_020501 [Syzygium grande]
MLPSVWSACMLHAEGSNPAYLEASEEIAALKESRRSINEMLGQVREELEMVDKIGDLRKCERKLLEANERTTIDGLEQLLERTQAQMRKLERVSDRTFEKCKKLMARAVKEAGFESDCRKGDLSSSIVVMNKRWTTWWRWTKMMELLRPFRRSTCKIGDEVEVGLSEAIREAAAKLKVKIDNDGGHVDVQGEGVRGWRRGEEVGGKD